MGKYAIGIDCATKPDNIGLVYGRIDGKRIKISDAEIGNSQKHILKLIISWIRKGNPCLLALDAPLGWPKKLGAALVDHFAGNQVNEEADNIFLRQTDRIIEKEIDLRPLSVGADKIARTAYAALKLIHELQNIMEKPIPFAWDCNLLEPLSIIEVYPAATLKAHNIPASRYKKKTQADMRKRIFNKLREYADFSCESIKFLENADVLDASVCVLAAADFLSGDVIKPNDLELAKKEGWIWVRKPKTV